jgi:hypothetical protein
VIRALITIIVLCVCSYGAEGMDAVQTADELERIDGLLASGQIASAQERMGVLADGAIVWHGAELRLEPALVNAVRNGHVALSRARLRAYIAALRGDAGTTETDKQRLRLIRLEQAERSAAAASDSATDVSEPAAWSQSLGERMIGWLKWTWDKLVALWDWLEDLLFGTRESGKSGGSGLTTYVVIGVVVMLGVVVLLALKSRRHAVQPIAAPGAPTDRRDADPRTRASDQWRDYAIELAKRGRAREAVRAWYHAVLVAAWNGGLIHHRTGRTNWEYAHALSADIGWRGEFLELTRRFDVAWYGNRESSIAVDDFAAKADRLLDALGVGAMP